MTKKFKFDLHTHPIEALKEKMAIKGIGNINKEVAAEIIKYIKLSGLNGIAITEHNNFNHSWVASLQIRDHFRGENLVILPGAEIEYKGQQFLQIYVPDFYRRRIPFFKGKEWFFILAHPGYYNPIDTAQISQITFDAVESKSIHGDFPSAESISHEKAIPVIRSSDAHRLEDLGLFNTELEYN